MTDSYADGWFDRFVADVQQLDAGVTPSTLLQDMIRFRQEAVQKDYFLEHQYANESAMRNWPTQTGSCDLRYADFLISYWDRKVLGKASLHSRLIQEIIDQIDAATTPWRERSNLLGVLSRDIARRGARKLPKKQNLWSAQAQHVNRKYAGFYAMLRFSSAKKIVIEPFCLQKIDDPLDIRSGDTLEARVGKSIHQCSMKFLWWCEECIWRGDLLVGGDKFSGLAIKDEISYLPDPVTFSIMRHRENRSSAAGNNIPFDIRPVLTGMIVGWNSINSDELFRSICAIEKFNTNLEPTLENFSKIVESSGSKKFFSNSEEWIGKRQLEEIFLQRKQRLHRRVCQEVLSETTIFRDARLDEWVRE
ncbi:MAG: hypothetical protein ACK5NN_01480 [Sphingomonadaceae bacterium]